MPRAVPIRSASARCDRIPIVVGHDTRPPRVSGHRGSLHDRIELAGRLCFWGGIVGALQGAVVLVALLTADPSGASRYSFPFSPGVFSVAQVTFAVQHLALVAGVLALVRVAGTTRPARAGLVGAGVGLVLLAVTELVAVAAARSSVDDPGPRSSTPSTASPRWSSASR